MLTCRSVLGAAMIACVLCSPRHAGAQAQTVTVSLDQYTYQTVNRSPFNGQLAFYAPEIRSNGTAITLPVTIQLLIGNGRRPFAADIGSMRPPEFKAYVDRLIAARAVRLIAFQITKKGERMAFQYLSRSFTVTATDLIPCRNCPNRVVLSLSN